MPHKRWGWGGWTGWGCLAPAVPKGTSRSPTTEPAPVKRQANILAYIAGSCHPGSPSARLPRHVPSSPRPDLGPGPRLHPAQAPHFAPRHFSLKGAARRGRTMVQEFTSRRVKGKGAQVRRVLLLRGAGWGWVRTSFRRVARVSMHTKLHSARPH